jgi:hypothetical protein
MVNVGPLPELRGSAHSARSPELAPEALIQEVLGSALHASSDYPDVERFLPSVLADRVIGHAAGAARHNCGATSALRAVLRAAATGRGTHRFIGETKRRPH